jgi:hypothetical protein
MIISERLGIAGVFRKDNVIISTLIGSFHYLIWLVVAILVVQSGYSLFHRTYSLDNEIGEHATEWISQHPETIMEQGLFFGRSEDCTFTGYDPNGALIHETEPEPQGIIPIYMRKEVNIGGYRYVFTIEESGIVITVIITSIAIAISMIIMMLHIHKVIRANRITATRFSAAKQVFDDCGECLNDLVTHKQLKKKYFNLPMCIIVPLAVVCLSCLSINLSIERHGRVTTETITNVVQHYGVLQDDQLVKSMDAIDKIDISTIDISDWQGTPLTEIGMEAIMSTKSGYIIENSIAHNCKLLNNDTVLDVSANMIEYYSIIRSYFIVLGVYIVYLILKINENVFIE